MNYVSALFPSRQMNSLNWHNIGRWQCYIKEDQRTIYIYIYQPLRSAIFYTRSIFKWILTGFEFRVFPSPWLVAFTKLEKPSLTYYSTIAGGRIIVFITFPRILVLCEMQSVASRIWTCFVVSMTYDDNHYTTSPSTINVLYKDQL